MMPNMTIRYSVLPCDIRMWPRTFHSCGREGERHSTFEVGNLPTIEINDASLSESETWPTKMYENNRAIRKPKT